LIKKAGSTRSLFSTHAVADAVPPDERGPMEPHADISRMRSVVLCSAVSRMRVAQLIIRF
jgi:hypothetical protein